MNKSKFLSVMNSLASELDPSNREVIAAAAKRSTRNPKTPEISIDDCRVSPIGSPATWRQDGYPTSTWAVIDNYFFKSPDLHKIISYRGENREPFHYHNSMMAELRPQIDNFKRTLTRSLDASKRLVDVRNASKGQRTDSTHRHMNNRSVGFELLYAIPLTTRYIIDRVDNNHSTNKLNFIATGWAEGTLDVLKEEGCELYTILVKNRRPILAKVRF